MSETPLVTIPRELQWFCVPSTSRGLHRRCGGGGITLGQQPSECLVLLFTLLQLFLNLLQI